MSDDAEIVTSVVALNGGILVGRTRLQKTVYLIARCGVSTDLEFEYHNFGPFSAKLAFLCDLAEAEGKLKVEERPGYHDVPYYIFRTDARVESEVGGQKPQVIRDQLATMKNFSAIELELAATLDFLRQEGVPESELDSMVAELKPVKSSKERLARSHTLLDQLGL